MHTQAPSRGQNHQEKPRAGISPIAVALAAAALVMLLGFLYQRNFGTAGEKLVRPAAPRPEAPEQYGLPAGAPQQAIEQRKQELAAQKAAPAGR